MEADFWEGYDGVEVMEGKVSGVPLVRNSRVPADLVAECLDEGEAVEKVAYNYDLNPADVLRLKMFRDTHKVLN